MKQNTTRLFRQAIRATTASLGTVASESGYARATFDKYIREKPPSEAAVGALADALQARGERLLDFAKRLREAVDDPGRAGGRT